MKKKRDDSIKNKSENSTSMLESSKSYLNELFMCSAIDNAKTWILD